MKKSVIEVSFPDGKKVDALVGQHLIKSDQSVKWGGEASAPEPFQLFLASIATCAGIFALSFCQSRKIPTEDMALSMTCSWDEDQKRYTRLAVDLKLPRAFPEKHKKAVIRAMDAKFANAMEEFYP